MFGEELSKDIKNLKDAHPNPESARGLFNESKDIVNDSTKKDLERAVAFYIVNKCSFSGLTESSSFSGQASESNFSFRGIEKLAEYGQLIENWKITNGSYEELLTDDPAVFIYSDPPYDIKQNLYGKSGNMHKGFDHDKFAADCEESCSDHLISYNSSQLVRDRFVNWNASEFDHTYTMRSVGKYMRDQQDRKELVLTNYML